jgi:hypothetical protein
MRHEKAQLLINFALMCSPFPERLFINMDKKTIEIAPWSPTCRSRRPL